MYKVLVLMSTYNGERYLSEQLDSLLVQRGVDVTILIRDDGSTDNTIQILNDYVSKSVNLSYYQGTNVGPCMSFFDLLSHANGYDYYAFSDQDDVWDEDKLLSAVKMLEQYTSESPLLYCSNLNIVDEKLNYCRISHPKGMKISNKYQGLVEFFAVGCTEVFNQKAVDLSLQYWSKNCIMHDSWLFMVCNFLGEVLYDKTPHINYRQHGKNVIGTGKNNTDRVKASFNRVFNRNKQPRLQNANALIESLSGVLPHKEMKKIRKIASYKDNIKNRFSLLFDYKIRAASIKRDIKYRILILMGLI